MPSPEVFVAVRSFSIGAAILALQVGLGAEIVPWDCSGSVKEKGSISAMACPFLPELNQQRASESFRTGCRPERYYRRKVAGRCDVEAIVPRSIWRLVADLRSPFIEEIAGNAGYQNDNGQSIRYFSCESSICRVGNGCGIITDDGRHDKALSDGKGFFSERPRPLSYRLTKGNPLCSGKPDEF